jgi:hypothetical protein
MKQLISIDKLLKKYNLSKNELFKIMHACIRYYLSEEELYNFILEFNMKFETRKNKRLQFN